ncbi:MAG: glycosyltransferase family 39 protein [Bacteroidetes bacterium]|nr:glycosyltransferase family 39 protein [Bacteroidota bacterium]
MPKKQLIILIPILLVVLNFILKFIHIDSQSIAGDEPFSIFHAQLGVSSIIEHLKQGNNPPLFEIILHYWIRLFGISAMSVRFLPLLFSTITVLFIYKIGTSFFNLRIAIVSSLLFTFSNYHLFFAHESRVYSLFALLTTISMFAFLKLQQDRKSRKHFILLIVTNILLIYSHYFGFWVLFIQLFIVLIFNQNRKELLRVYLIGLGIIAIAYIPMWRTFFERFFVSASNGTWLQPPGNAGALYFMLWQFTNKPVATSLSILVLVASIIKFVILKDYKSIGHYKFQINIATWFALPFLLMFVLSFKVPMFHDRYLVFLSVALYILIAISIHYLLPKFKYKYFLDALVILMFIVTFNPNVDNKRHTKEAVAKVKELRDEQTLVIISPYYFMPTFTYYYDTEYFKLTDRNIPYTAMNEKLTSENIYSVYAMNQNLNEKLESFNKVIFLDAAADFANPNNNIRKTLDSRFEQKEQYFFYEIFNLCVYTRKKSS